MRFAPSRRTALLGLGAISACKPASTPLANAKGLGIANPLPRDGMAWLSTFKVAETIIDHICVEESASPAQAGVYYPTSKSPAFTRVNAESVLGLYEKAHQGQVQAMINCSFFERYDPVTELSFPIKRSGVILTGGSSPYGPRENPADARYKRVVLQALVWNDSAIEIKDYDSITGAPLAGAEFPNSLVTYKYEDHPANILAGDPVGQYQLLALRSDGTLLVLTITKGRMVDGASVLRASGSVGPILTVDGGPSTHLWTKTTGAVIATKSVALPHYLGFRLRV